MSGPLDTWLIELTSLQRLQLTAVRGQSGDMLPTVCVEYEVERSPSLSLIINYINFLNIRIGCFFLSFMTVNEDYNFFRHVTDKTKNLLIK